MKAAGRLEAATGEGEGTSAEHNGAAEQSEFERGGCKPRAEVLELMEWNKKSGWW